MPNAVVKPFIVYTALRIAVFAALLGLFWLVGVHGYLGLFAAVIVSLPASFVLLRRQRATLTAALATRVTGRQRAKADLRARLRGDQPAD